MDKNHDKKLNEISASVIKMRCVDQFNQILYWTLSNVITNNIYKTLIKTGIMVNTVLYGDKWYIERFGPFIYKFRDKIIISDVKYFLDHKFEAQIKDTIGDFNISYDTAIGIRDSIKIDAVNYLGRDPKLALAIPKKALSLYCKYVATCIQNK